MKKLALHWQIMIGMIAGVLFGILVSYMGWQEFVAHWIKPFGTIFISLLKLIAIPLILASLIKGISDLQDISKFKNMGLRTVILYVLSTVVAISIGLAVVNIIQPGEFVSSETVAELTESYSAEGEKRVTAAVNQKSKGPLQFIVDMVPQNIFGAASHNGNMLQVIFFVIFFGVCLLLIDQKQAKVIHNVVTAVNEAVMKMVDLIMLMAPFAVFALLANFEAADAA